MNLQDQDVLMKKTSVKVEKQVKYLGITLSNMNCVLFHNNYLETWKETRKDLLN